MNRKYYLLVNIKAGGGNGRNVVDKIIQKLELEHQEYDIFYTEYAGHEKEITIMLAEEKLFPWKDANREEKQLFPLLVVLGGDGTLHNVVDTLKDYDSSIPVGYIPCGTGNDFARGSGISLQAEKAFLQLFYASEPQPLQMITYQEEIQLKHGVAVNNIGIGLDAAIVNVANKSQTKNLLNKVKLGSLSYIFSVLHVLLTKKSFPIRVVANGKNYSFQHAFLCTASIHPYFGGGVAIIPTASSKKNSLDLLVVERVQLIKIIWLIYLLIRKKHLKSKYCHHIKSNNIQIVSSIPQYTHADGEILAHESVNLILSTETRLFWF